MKSSFTILGVSTVGLYFTGLLAFGSWKATAVSLMLILAGSLALSLALQWQHFKHRRRARLSGRSVTTHEHNGVRVYHPDGSRSFIKFE